MNIVRTRTRFFYLRDVQGNPHTCVAINMDHLNNRLSYALSRRESPDRKIRLKRRIQRIRENGGLVPHELYVQLDREPDNYTKKLARERAAVRLRSAPVNVEVQNLSNLTVHEITFEVLRDIAMNDATFVMTNLENVPEEEILNLDRARVIMRSAPRQAVDSARLWIRRNILNVCQPQVANG